MAESKGTQNNGQATASSALRVTTETLPSGVVGSDYAVQLGATGGIAPYTWSNTGESLPAGLDLTSAGLISGQPKDVCDISLTVSVSDKSGSADERSVKLVVTESTESESENALIRDARERATKFTNGRAHV